MVCERALAALVACVNLPTNSNLDFHLPVQYRERITAEEHPNDN
jgi:hypothetical protein